MKVSATVPSHMIPVFTVAAEVKTTISAVANISNMPIPTPTVASSSVSLVFILGCRFRFNFPVFVC